MPRGLNLVQKILKQHLVSGKLEAGTEIGVQIDQVLTQDATGTMAFLQFEAMNIPRIRCKLAVSYVDHNMLQATFENADDHLFLQTIAAKYGAYFSRPGNGICHQVHLERFAVPGATLLGSDSHTPTSGGMGCLAIGTGGLDVSCAMAGGPFYFTMPKVVRVHLKGNLGPWMSGKDIILEMLRRLTVRGGIGKIFEYVGEGIDSLNVPDRSTITNMGAELGATSSIFPSDRLTRKYLRAQGRESSWIPLQPDRTATYDEEIEIDLGGLEPMIACPHSPDNVKKVKEVEGIPVVQVGIGSCTNSSYRDLMTVGAILRGKKIHPNVSLGVNPGSRQVLEMIARSGALADIISSGARILENACGGCIGMGQAPPTDGVSVRSYNRNFEGRAGTPSARVYLASPEVAAACALRGEITDPRKLGDPVEIPWPKRFLIDDGMILPPAQDPARVEVIRGPNIKPLPIRGPLEQDLRGEVLLKVGDNITTDHILPAGAKVLPLRSNIPAISEYVFERIDPTFPKRAKEKVGGFVVGGENYGQGSSREHAALAPMFLGLKAVFAVSFARIHRANLINFGILPVTFARKEDYAALQQGDLLELTGVSGALEAGRELTVSNKTRGSSFSVRHDMSAREIQVLVSGGRLNHAREQGELVSASAAS